jgi:transcriptional regulator GlxA family with amidase domain
MDLRKSHKTSGGDAAKTVVFLACPGFDVLDLTGPWEVFHVANLVAPPRSPRYELAVVTTQADLRVMSHAGLAIEAHRTAAGWRKSADTLIVPAAAAMFGDAMDPALVSAVRRLAARSRRVASVCAGAFLLAAAGLLDGRRATTHWGECQRLADRYPAVRVEPDAIYVKDGGVYTSAGVTAGMDLALALVEEDLGREVALTVARQLVMYVRRAGGQTQFSATLEGQLAEREPIRELLTWAADNPGADLSVEAMAARAHMSARNFSRVFHKEVGQSPARFVERLRVDAARQRLEETDAPHDRIAADCGFGSGNSMRRSFLRLLKVTPSDYRDRFRRPGGTAG